MMPSRHSCLHSNTPQTTVLSSARNIMKVLRILRSPQYISQPARILTSLNVSEVLARTTRLYGARPLLDHAGTPRAEAVMTHTLGAQLLCLQTADGDTELSLWDTTGRPLWSQNAQCTVSTVEYEPPQKQDAQLHVAGRPLTMSEQPAGNTARIKERFTYAPVDNEHKNLNLAGNRYAHYHNAGFSIIRSVSLNGEPLASDIHLLAAEAAQPDWKTGNDIPTEPPLSTSATYDSIGLSLTATNAAMATTVTTYDVSGAIAETRLRYGVAGETLTAEVVTLNNIQRQADGTVLSQCSGNGVVDTYEYDARARYLTRHTTARPPSHSYGALLFSDLHYRYDPAGNILTFDDKGTDPQWHGNQKSTGLRTYTYDTLYRLTSATGRQRVSVARYPTDPSGGSVWKPFTEAYEYDDGDNLTCVSHLNSGIGYRLEFSVATDSNRAVVKENGLKPEDGFLAGGLQKQLTSGHTLNWYADNQLRQVVAIARADDGADDTETYQYADGGSRSRKVRTVKTSEGTQIFITTYAGGCEVRQRFLSSQANPQRHVIITHCGSVRLIEDRVGGKKHLRYSFNDHLGSIAGETGEDGRITAREEYAPWGNTVGNHEEAVEVSNLMQRTHRYAGKELDATGLIYYGWRYCQSGFGRWLSADPGKLIDGVNLYRFCRNNPVNIIDSDGRGCASSSQTALPEDPLVLALDHATSNFDSNISPDKTQHKLDTDVLDELIESENSRAGKHDRSAPLTIKYYKDTGSFAFSLFRAQQKVGAVHYQAVVHMQPDLNTRGHVTAFDIYRPEGGGRITLINVDSAIRERRRRAGGQATPDDAVEAGFKHLEQAIMNNFPNASRQPRIQLHETEAQKSPNDCGIFSIANARIMSQFPDKLIKLHETFTDTLKKEANGNFIHDGMRTDLLSISSKFFKYTHSDTLLNTVNKFDPTHNQGSIYINRNSEKALRVTRDHRDMNIGIEAKRQAFLKHAIKYHNQ